MHISWPLDDVVGGVEKEKRWNSILLNKNNKKIDLEVSSELFAERGLSIDDYDFFVVVMPSEEEENL